MRLIHGNIGKKKGQRSVTIIVFRQGKNEKKKVITVADANTYQVYDLVRSFLEVYVNDPKKFDGLIGGVNNESNKG